jgi:hypothetical protein
MIAVAVLCGVNMLGCEKTTQRVSEQDNRLLALVLTQKSPDGGFTVVSPDTSLGVTMDEPADIAERRAYIAKGLELPGVDIAKIVDAFAAKNAKSVRLTLKSAPEAGYIVDYAGEYSKYFKEGGGGWEQWRKDHPQAHGSTTVSLPHWDKPSGIVLCYVGQQVGWLAGSGFVIAYKYDGKTLTELKRIMLWIS